MSILTVVSYPKSGRTWLRYIFGLAGIDAAFTHAGYATGPHNIGKRFGGVGFDFDCPPDQRLLLLVRDPLDTAVSYYFQVHRRELSVGNAFRRAKRRFRLLLLGRAPPRDIGKFVLSDRHGIEKIVRFNQTCLVYLDKRGGGLVVTYEDMHRNLSKELGRIFDYVDPGLSSRLDLREIARRSSFDSMRALEESGSEDWRLRPVNWSDPDSFKIRKGRSGGYREYLNEDTIERARLLYRRLGQPWPGEDGSSGSISLPCRSGR